MLLRRVTEHVRTQNWFAVGLDFLIVVVGVFIGIQVSNWNDARAERAMERRIILSLLDDMHRSAADIERSNSWLSRQMADQSVLLNALEACEVNEGQRTAVARGLSDLGKFEFAVIDRQLINQLRASGQFDIIRNPEIRSLLNNVIQSSDKQLRVEPNFGGNVNPLIAYALRFYYFEIPESAHSTQWENLRFDIDNVCRDFEFISAVGNTRVATRNLHNWNARILTQVKAAEAALVEETGSRGWRQE